MPNLLAGETSPYLLQHADNPVAWQPWREAAFQQARQEDKPLLLSIGYSACHWCHVMAHESFENDEVAAVMNRLFVNIKVDREERPDIDQIYQTAHQMLTGRPGGWPLTMFLTPDGVPFFGGTYFPRQPRYGLPGFAELCEKVAATWRNQRPAIEGQNREMLAALHATGPAPVRDENLGASLMPLARQQLLRSLDPHWGGFGAAPKFPHCADLSLLLALGQGGDQESLAAAVLTLDRMAGGGLFDQLGGGFCRYSVDERWEIPHFEKMLYDNGPLLGLYAEAFALTGKARFAEVAEATVAWLLREMTLPGGGFASSLDADSEGEEGRFYVWDKAEVRGLLTDEAWAVAEPAWRLDRPANFEDHHWHLQYLAPAHEDRPALDAARRKLWQVRESRVRPGRDDKVLTAWNALMIQGLARAARLLDRPSWLAAARQALAFLRAEMFRDGRLLATHKDGRSHLNAYLDDHAFLLAAVLELMQAGYQAGDGELAVQLAELLLNHFQDADAGGFFFTSVDHESLIHRPKAGHEGAMASGNGLAALALQRLGYLLGEPRYLEAARRTLLLFAPEAARNPAAFTTLLLAHEEALAPPAQVILRGPAEAVGAWQRELARQFPGLFVLALPHGIPSLPPALAKPEGTCVNAWVCQGVSCLAPVAELPQLRAILRKR